MTELDTSKSGIHTVCKLEFTLPLISAPEKLTLAKDALTIMHPLPRVNEISVAVDADPRACYFKQVLNGKYMRMALILKLLGIK